MSNNLEILIIEHFSTVVTILEVLLATSEELHH
jgi:hypothetical protein